jgi:hypothetical protein
MSGTIHSTAQGLRLVMPGFPSPFRASEEALFDSYDKCVPAHIPEPGAFLEDHLVLDGGHHRAFHRLTREIFEERTVYDMTFNYNLARLNLDTRHPNAGYRYAEEADDQSILRAEFTPTTPFCPQTHTLTTGSFRAWNGLSARHAYDLVRVRADRMHHQSAQINDQLISIEERYRETGEMDLAGEQRSTQVSDALTDGTSAGTPDAPF